MLPTKQMYLDGRPNMAKYILFWSSFNQFLTQNFLPQKSLVGLSLFRFVIKNNKNLV